MPHFVAAFQKNIFLKRMKIKTMLAMLSGNEMMGMAFGIKVTVTQDFKNLN